MGEFMTTDIGGEQGLGLSIGETGIDSLHRGIAVKGQPGGTGEGDTDLRNEQLGAAWLPQTHHIAGANATLDEAAGNGTGFGQNIGIGQPHLARHDGRLCGIGLSCRDENFRERLVADQVGHHGPAQDSLVVSRINRKSSAAVHLIHRLHRRAEPR